MKHPHLQKGYTLIELLLYIAILSSLLISVSLYFALTADSRIKNQTISEVNQQGELLLDLMTQTIRNADAITAPTIGGTASSLTLAVPTSAQSPTIFGISGGGGGSTLFGRNIDGVATDTSDNNYINTSKFTATASGTISTLYARVGATIASSPNNKAQMAIYTGASNPSTLLASSTATTLAANSWNAFTIAPVSITSGQVYWLAYNTNGVNSSDNNLRYQSGGSGQSRFIPQSYNSWPASFTGTVGTQEFSMYGMIDTPAASGSLEIKEGAAAAVPLTNSNVEVSNMTFKNLSRSGTPGVVQISFTISRINPSDKNEYDYQKTFTGTAAARH